MLVQVENLPEYRAEVEERDREVLEQEEVLERRDFCEMMERRGYLRGETFSELMERKIWSRS